MLIDELVKRGASRLSLEARVFGGAHVNGGRHSLKVSEGVPPGRADLPPPGLRLSVEKSGANSIARPVDGEAADRQTPSVDVLFRSAARVVRPHALGLMLAGMGANRARAVTGMHEVESWNDAQDQASCVLFGMPREAIAAGPAREALPLGHIAAALIGRLRGTAASSLSRV
jgi:two-component system, chemotaxis family, protein-glutamate methylesterase/glutaminase